MRAVIQRVSSAKVSIAGEVSGAIERGLLVLLGVAQTDTEADAQWLADKIAALRIFEDDAGKMNRSLRDIAESEDREQRTENGNPTSSPAIRLPSSDLRPLLLVVSQFTLFASTRKGTRPSFNDAAKPELAIPLYEAFVRFATTALGKPVATGKFGAMMEVSLVNDGPVTLVIDTKTRE